MAALNYVLAAVLLSLASANPDHLQHHGAPRAGYPPTGSSGPDAVRSGLISEADASAFGSSSSSSSSGLSSPSGSRFLADAAGSGGSAVNTGRSPFFGSAQSVVSLSSSQNVNSGLLIDESLGDVTITQETTVDVFKTVTNVIYNSIPITLTEFIKTTAVQPTFQVLSTPVDDHVFVATAPVTRTDSVTVTNTNTGYFYVTEVSTDTYTITHKAYAILQTTLTSTLQQTKVFHPTVVRTRINTEYDTQTVEYFVTNTVVIQPFDSGTGRFTQRIPFVDQQGSGQGQQGFGSRQGTRN